MHRFFALVLALFLLHISEASAQNVPIMSTDEIERGMEGIGKSTFEGARIDTFGVEILGVMKNYEPKMDLVIARLSDLPGSPIDRAQQVIAGMSGSPVYIDGKLIGAIAYGWYFEKEPICGITPIEGMMGVLRKDLGRKPGYASSWTRPLKGKEVAVSDDIVSGKDLESLDGLALRPIASPIALSGFSSDALQEMMPALSRMGLIPMQSGSLRSSDIGDPRSLIEPGASVGVQLVSGDMEATMVGTLTYREGDKVLAFGHPAFFDGWVDLPMTAAYVHDVLPSMSRSAKLASATEPVGAIRQDRLQGVAGILGDIPDMIPVRVSVSSPSERKTYNFKVLREKEYAPFFIYRALQSALSVAERNFGDATVEAEVTLNLEGYSRLNMGNIYSSPIAFIRASLDLVNPIGEVMGNDFKTVRVDSVAFDIRLEDERIKSAYIENVYLPVTVIEPGDSTYAVVHLRSYRGEPSDFRVPILVPDDIPEGELKLFVCDAATSLDLDRQRAPGKYFPRDFDHLLDILFHRERNDEIHVKLYMEKRGLTIGGVEFPSLPPSAMSILTSPGVRGDVGPVSGSFILTESVRTGYVVQGSYSVPFIVRRGGFR